MRHVAPEAQIEDRVSFALEKEGLARCQFASSFQKHPEDGDIDWKALAGIADPTEIGVSYQEFVNVVDRLKFLQLRKIVESPFVFAVMDFRLEAMLHFSLKSYAPYAPTAPPQAPDWFEEFVQFAIKHKLGVSAWKVLPEKFDIDRIPVSDLQAVARLCGKLWGQRCPDWVAPLRARAKEQSAARAPRSAAERPASVAGAPPVTKANEGLEEEDEEGQDEEEEDDDVEETKEEGTKEDEVKKKEQKDEGKKEQELSVGDIVKLGASVGKQFQGCKATVLKVTCKQIQVQMMSGRKEGGKKTFNKTAAATILSHSALKSTSASAAESSGSAAAAPESAAERPESAPAVNEAAYAESLFGD